MRTFTHPFRILAGVTTFCSCLAVVQAAPISYSINIDLSSLHAGSSYSGSVTVPNPLSIGGSTPILLLANPSGQYTPSSINDTLSITSGPSGFNSVFISPLVFTDTSTLKQYNFIVNGAAHCDVTSNPNGIPCQTTGQLIGNNANGGSALYAVTIAPAAAVPEPAYGFPLLATTLIIAIVLPRYKSRTPRSNPTPGGSS